METVQICARISKEANHVLREAAESTVSATGRLPIGEILDALIFYLNDIGHWQEVMDDVMEKRNAKRNQRLAKDRDRKRR
jgi:hypothetical protein